MFDYKTSLKSSVSDELINTYLMRPLAGLIVWPLSSTPVTPNHLTLASIAAGLLAANFYLRGTPAAVLVAGLCITLKDLLDSADGQLARAKDRYSRAGRFLDSIGDFVVNLAVFVAIGLTLHGQSGEVLMIVLAALGFLGITLRVSYHVFYHTSFLHLHNLYGTNRLVEEITEEDRQGDRTALILQRIFLLLYGWQDRLVLRLDRWCRGGREDREFLARWYADRTGVRLSGFLGLGTELFLLMVCSVTNRLELYLYLNLFVMNGVLAVSVVYRRSALRGRLS